MTIEQVALAAAMAAFEIIERELANNDERKEAAEQVRRMLSDAKLMLRADAQAMLDARRRG